MDDWREDGSFRSMKGGKQCGKKDGPQFTRVIPKFLQKYHEPSGIQAKFQPSPPPDGDADEIDEVEKAAIEEYIQQDKEKEKNVEAKQKSNNKRQRMAEIGSGKVPSKKGKKATKTLDNKKLLSFSMEEE